MNTMNNTHTHWLSIPAVIATLRDDETTRTTPYTVADIDSLGLDVTDGERKTVATVMNDALERNRRARAPYKIAKTRLSTGHWLALQQLAQSKTALGVSSAVTATGTVVLDFDASPARLDAVLEDWRSNELGQSRDAQSTLKRCLVDVLCEMLDTASFVLHIEDRVDDADPYADNDEVNTNVLTGIKCPVCASAAPFMIDTQGIPAENVDPMVSQSGIMRMVAEGELSCETFAAEYDDDGSTDVAGDSEFVSEGEASCLVCGHAEPLPAFYTIHE
jgi:hypothetical protein